MSPIEQTSSANKYQIMQNLKKLMWKKILSLALQKVHAIFIRIEMILKQHPVSISLTIFIVSIVLLAYFRNETTISFAVAAFGVIFVALQYRLAQANYHKNLFEDRFAIFNTIDEVMREWAIDTKATREMVNKLN